MLASLVHLKRLMKRLKINEIKSYGSSYFNIWRTGGCVCVMLINNSTESKLFKAYNSYLSNKICAQIERELFKVPNNKYQKALQQAKRGIK